MTDQAPEAAGQAEAPVSEGQAVWYESAPDEVKGYIQNKGWDDPFKAVSSYQELEKFRGANENELLRLPKDPDAEGAYDAIYTKLGRPDSVDGYEINIPENVTVDDARLNGAKELAHKLGLNQKQLQGIIDFDSQYYSQAQAQYEEQVAQQQEAEYNALRREWGSNADEREELSRRGLRSILPEGMDKESTLTKIEDAIGTAAMLKLFANVGDKMAREDRIHEAGNERPFGYTKEQASADKKALMSELSADEKRLSAYNQGKGADYDKMRRLNEIIAS